MRIVTLQEVKARCAEIAMVHGDREKAETLSCQLTGDFLAAISKGLNEYHAARLAKLILAVIR